ncbi:M20 aminoacylase family protein [Hydrogenophaga crocea]|uniref:Amidohydrolase n=1 Tax=Hydrogenophaga crocea TaxID=2716225 RepID=A0A6G8IC80_9BURK|nr:M20 aminoacylase family protein [Hydrogenophaga crocea]QIM50743.1 amidohydrolase [Hydrogenophaga crocea]
MTNLIESISAYQDELVAIRQDFHKNPELGFEEHRTAARIAAYLNALGIPTHTGIGRTGVVGVIEGRSTTSGASVGLRADMDALPIIELGQAPYKSCVPGRMHGCGHDGHCAILLGTARYLSQTRRFNGTVYLFFQPGEEGHAGAREMIQEGLFERFPAQRVFALHNWPSLPAGHVGLNEGPMMAAIDRIHIRVQGKGGHGAHPHQAIDPILVASQIVSTVHTIVSRSVNPADSAVVSFQSIQAGSPDALSVIPDGATLDGMVKWFKPQVQDVVRRRLHEVVSAVAAAHGAHAELRYDELYPPTINTPGEARLLASVAQRLLGHDKVDAQMEPSMGSEDFAFMLQQRPGAYFRLGQGMQEGRFLHHPMYDFNDTTIPVGSALFSALVEEAMPL